MNKYLLFLITIILLLSFNVFKNVSHVVYAEDDDEHEEEKEDEDEEHDRYQTEDDDEYENENIIEVVVPNTTNLGPAQTTSSNTKPVIRYIKIIDPGFDVDSDGDKLVDAIDPNPKISEFEFFTDDDKDGVANIADEYTGEDDFAYLQFTDKNENGIADDIEE